MHELISILCHGPAGVTDNERSSVELWKLVFQTHETAHRRVEGIQQNCGCSVGTSTSEPQNWTVWNTRICTEFVFVL